jgi:predicted O-methyltransferase YrrM
MNVVDSYIDARERRQPRCEYVVDFQWEERLHGSLGLPWPCVSTSEFWLMWSEIIRDLAGQGIRMGPESFGANNDADAAFARALWCLTRHLHPNHVIETGVAHGVTTRVVLEAMARNERGHLWSIDLPPVEHESHARVGAAVGGRFADRWSYIRGSSRVHLPDLLSRLGQIDLFIHDSVHSERNVRFEADLAWTFLRRGGAVVIDDIDANRGFRSFTETMARYPSLVCEAEPTRPDARRFNQRGLFGVVLKERRMTAA